MSTMNSGEPEGSLLDHLREHPNGWLSKGIQAVLGLLGGALIFWLAWYILFPLLP